MTREQLQQIFESVEDRAWEGSWQHRDDVSVVACDTDEEHGATFDWHDGRPAIVVNHGAVLVPRLTSGDA